MGENLPEEAAGLLNGANHDASSIIERLLSIFEKEPLENRLVKNIRNSSKLPSGDSVRPKPKSFREQRSGKKKRKPGGQAGS